MEKKITYKNDFGERTLTINDETTPVKVYTFNDDSMQCAKEVVKLIERYGAVSFHTGVSGRTLDRMIIEMMRDNITLLIGERVTITTDIFGDYIYTLK